ncbi:MAG TPA: GNAT family N-acetyltransferase [Nanoarchaeota archaeon]|nr:GNAT family N-acetyltransferase [Candidatus Woesearchaeota archaeon]HIH14655.1 GNAT family N-acetyltransferase [Nanoarchaeota archaeon]HIH59157.1 GNAT family N-acetyltransferase [Nanoarchaeota archaeon]HII14165.1 GNAT family N-acetyltransferase [Nanoarchaeota archaeon]HIJ05616.1 GNAT family N-acetyltransferase [Nanoarchaeota archaeon]
MNILFKEYKEGYFEDLVSCMENLQDFLIEIDPLQRLRRLPSYGIHYTNDLIDRVSQGEGLIILAYDQEKIVGCIAGAIEKQPEENLLECRITKPARILELFVLESYRGFHVGKNLVEKMERYFQENGCDIIRVEVFVPNKNAYTFYQKFDYSERVVELVKTFKK